MTARHLAPSVVLASALLGLAPSPAPAPERPSVLLIVASGLGSRLSCYGASVDTPHIDRLARMGRRFSRAYAPYPDAPASLASLMTGLAPDKTGAWSPSAERPEGALPVEEAFQAAGYSTVRVGPLFRGKAEAAYSWGVTQDAGGAGLRARNAADVLAAKSQGPLFLAVSLDATKAPPEVLAKYPPTSVRLQKGEEWGDIPAIAVSPAQVERPGRLAHPTPIAPANRQTIIAAENARVAFLDSQVGTIEEALDRLKLWDRFVVVFVSDHGPDLGEHGELLRKDLLYEETLRTSLIIVAPGMNEAGKQAEALTELVDVYPTLTDLCGLKKPAGLEGRSLSPLIQNPSAQGRSAVVSVAARDAGFLGRSVRTSHYRYSEWPDGSEELYDHEKDPHEWVNLALSPPARAPIADLKRLLDERDASALPPPAIPGPTVKPGTKKKNVLFVVFDDLTVHLGSYGYPVQTPNIDRLAKLGRRFDRAYAQVAMCSPSRMSFMTGWRPERINVWNNAENPWESVRGSVPLQEHFHQNGYFTGRVGKVYHGKWNDLSSWDLALTELGLLPEPPPSEARATARLESDNDNPTDISHFWLETDNKDEDEPDGRRAALAVKFLQEHWKHPFFLAVGFGKPHLRWVAPKKYFSMYSPGQVKAVPDPEGDADDIPAIAIANEAISRPRLLLQGTLGDFDEAARARALAAQYACVSFVDAQLGVVLKAMDQLDLWSDTIIVLIGDHGFQLGEHGLWRKDTLFEESAHAPLIIVAPQVRKPGEASEAVVEFMDIYPTLTELAQLTTPPGVQGQSLVPQLLDPRAKSRGAAFTFRVCAPPPLGRSVRDDRYRFTEWPDGSDELYDLTNDPLEQKNIASVLEMGPLEEAMRKLLYR